MNDTDYDYSAFLERVKKRRNIRFLIVSCIAAMLGMMAVFNFWRLLLGYSKSSVSMSAFRASDMYMSYIGFSIFLMAMLVCSILCGRREKKSLAITRNIVIFVALVLNNMSITVVTALTTYVMTEYVPATYMISEVDIKTLTDNAVANPAFFYTFMVAEAIVLVVALSLIFKRVKAKNNKRYV